MPTYYRVQLDPEDASWLINSSTATRGGTLDIEDIGDGLVEFDGEALDWFRQIDADDDGSITEGGIEAGVDYPIQMWIGGTGHAVTEVRRGNDADEPARATAAPVIAHGGPGCVGDCTEHGRLCELTPHHDGDHACPQCPEYLRLERAEMIADRIATHRMLHETGFITTDED